MSAVRGSSKAHMDLQSSAQGKTKLRTCRYSTHQTCMVMPKFIKQASVCTPTFEQPQLCHSRLYQFEVAHTTNAALGVSTALRLRDAALAYHIRNHVRDQCYVRSECCMMQTHAELPITLILGMATSAGALQQMLPVAAASMLEAQHFQLASSMERYTPCCCVLRRGLNVDTNTLIPWLSEQSTWCKHTNTSLQAP